MTAASRPIRSFWSKCGLGNIALLPAAGLFACLVFLRRLMYRIGVLRQIHVGVPTVIVGSITAGGGGKTPLVQALVAGLIERGCKPGIVARGYRGSAVHPQLVQADDDPAVCGDEPVLHARQTDAPVAIGADRVEAASILLRECPEIDAIVSDDGLQHYALARDFEIAAVDQKALGNGWLLPAGPLRETKARLQSCDAIVRKQAREGEYELTVTGHEFERISDRSTVSVEHFDGMRIAAVTGIAQPAAFFAQLTDLGIKLVHQIAYPDHHSFAHADLTIAGADAVVMTAKDAVKCNAFSDLALYALNLKVAIDPSLADRVAALIRQSTNDASKP